VPGCEARNDLFDLGEGQLAHFVVVRIEIRDHTVEAVAVAVRVREGDFQPSVCRRRAAQIQRVEVVTARTAVDLVARVDVDERVTVVAARQSIVADTAINQVIARATFDGVSTSPSMKSSPSSPKSWSASSAP